MHGRKRKQKGDAPEAPAETSKRAAKVKAYTKLSNAILKLRVAVVASAGDPILLNKMETNALKATSKMAAVNPDFYTLWNFRRDILTNSLIQSTEEDDAAYQQRASDISTIELNLTEIALTKRNPKCYYAWHHRKWIVGVGICDLNAELALCARFLERDERNFHCWTYRRCITSLLNVSLKDEFQFTEDLIQRNFSNGSAWHQRTRVLSGGNTTLELELGKLKEAIYTEPDDQSTWMYHRWILSNLLNEKRSTLNIGTNTFYIDFMKRLSGTKNGGESSRGGGNGGSYGGSGGENASKGEQKVIDGKDVNNKDETKEMIELIAATATAIGTSIENIFQQEMNMCRELISVEPTCRWPRLQLVHMIDLCLNNINTMPTIDSNTNDLYQQERIEILNQLLVVDPTHAKFYEYQLKK